jgi:hypothetical protein
MIFEEVYDNKIYHKNIGNNNDQNINYLTYNKFIEDKNEPYNRIDENYDQFSKKFNYNENTYNDIKRKQEYKNRNIKLVNKNSIK